MKIALLFLMASISSADFLSRFQNQMSPQMGGLSSFMGQGGSPLLAANVLVPDMETGFKKNVDYPQLPETFPGGQKAKYRAVGEFGQFENEEQAQQAAEYGRISPNQMGKIRGYMDFIPGGIPASQGFDYDKSLQTFPQLMQGIQRGNMPVFRTY